jgi:membrane-associated phospholipid phosphatase
MTPLTLLLLMTAPGQVPAAAPDLVLKWNEIALTAIRTDRTPPPMAARNLAIMHIAIYDAVNAVAPTHRACFISAVPQGETSAPAAAASAGHYVLASLYPALKAHIDTELSRCLTTLPADAARDNGVELGRFVAGRVLEWRRNDGAANPGRYNVRQALGIWQPTPPRYLSPLLPEWGNVEPFVMRKGTQYQPAGPPPLNSQAYAQAFNEVKAIGGRTGTTRTPEQTQIAFFWADDLGTSTPPGHWNQIAQDVARQRGTSLADNARLFALLNISLADAGILCWVIKFSYDYWRPVTAIQHADADDNPATEPDPGWLPLLDTPPFPSYTSGHSTFSGAGATALARFFGRDDVPFTTVSEGLPNVRRSFAGFWQAAEEAGMSRIYGGIHYQFDNTDGLATGRVLSEYVARNYFQPLLPRERPPVVIAEPLPE